MDMARAVRAGPPEELLPVPVRRLVGPDVGGDDRLVERDADQLFGRGDVVGIGVREDREPPAANASLLERRRAPPGTVATTAESRPARLGVVEARRLPQSRAARARASGPPGKRARPVRLELGLDLVIPVQEPVRSILAEDVGEHRPDAAVPVDQRAVAVEGRPALHPADTSAEAEPSGRQAEHAVRPVPPGKRPLSEVLQLELWSIALQQCFCRVGDKDLPGLGGVAQPDDVWGGGSELTGLHRHEAARVDPAPKRATMLVGDPRVVPDRVPNVPRAALTASLGRSKNAIAWSATSFERTPSCVSAARSMMAW